MTWAAIKMGLAGFLQNQHVRTVIITLVAVAAVLVAVERCSTAHDAGAIAEMQRMVNEKVNALLEQDRAALEKIQTQMDAIHWELENIQQRIDESVREREEVRDAINTASSIDDIDRILKAGISGHSGRRGQ